jgi:hypothetical protein
MKIKKIKIKYFNGLSDIDEDVKGANLIICGENGVGKSRLMRFIEIALGRNNNIPPIAEGEGHVVADKDGNEYTFHVKFKDNKPVLTITTPDGLSDSRKGTIAGIVGAINFDIHEFVEDSKTEKGRKDQVEVFKKLLPKEIQDEVAKLEANVKYNYDLRTDVNRALKATQGKIELHPMHKPGVNLEDFKEIDIAKEYDKLNAANEHNTKVENVKTRVEDRASAILDLAKEQLELNEKLKQIQDKLVEYDTLQKAAKEWLSQNPIIDSSELQSTIQTANQSNETFKQAQELIQLKKDAEIYKEQSGTATANIDSQRQAISDAIKDMSNPVPGLEFNDIGLVYNGFPVSPDSLSYSEIIELGVKMKMAENPELPLFISNGESIGTQRLNDIKEIAKKNNLQIIMEQVERGNDKLTIEVMEG